MDQEIQKKPKSPIAVYAYALLAKKAYFSKQLKAKLVEKGYGEEEIASFMAQLTERGWLNDQELAERYVARQIEKGNGARVVAMKLREKAGNIDCVIEESEEALAAFVRKRYLKDLPEKKNKVIGALMRRGFSYDLIKKVLGTIMEDHEVY